MDGADRSAGSASVPLVGRDRELTILVDLLDGARHGRGGVALVAGEPGIGKTRLLDALVERAAGIATGVAACLPDEQPAFWVWRRALESAAMHAGDRLAASLRDAAQATARDSAGDALAFGDERLERFERVRRHLTGSAEPVALVLDDLHWADTASARLLAHLLPDLHRMPVVVLGSYRTDEVAPDTPLAGLVGRGGAVHHLTLTGLDPADTARVAAAFAGVAAPAVSPEALHDATGGNPLFARELGRLLGDQIVAGGSMPVPDSVRAVIERRLDRLAADARQIVDIAAVGGGPSFTVARVAAVAGVDAADVLDVLEDLAHTGLLAPADDPECWSFSHALIRQTAYDALGARRRAELHVTWANVLSAEPDPRASVRDLARHHMAAVPLVPRQRAAQSSRAAGEEALREMAYEDAVRHLTDALTLDRPTEPVELTEAFLVLGDAQFRAGERAASEATFGDAVALARVTGRTDHLARAALGFGAGPGGFEIVPSHSAQVDALEAAAAALPGDDASLRARVLARLSVATAGSASVERRITLAEEAVAMARRLRDPRLLAYVLSALCDAVAGPDHVSDRLVYAGEMLALSAQARDSEMELLARRLRIVAHLERGDDQSFRSDCDAYTRVAERLRDPLYRWYGPFFAATMAMNRGNFDEAAALRDHAAGIGREASSFNAELLVDVQRANQLFFEGRYAELADAFFGYASRYPDIQVIPAYPLICAAIRGLAGDTAAARELAASAPLDDIARDSEWLTSMCWSVLPATLLGDVEMAATLYDRMLPYRDLFAVDGIAAGCFGSVAGWLAPLAELLGEHEAARDHRTAAVTANRRAGLPVVADHVGRFGAPWQPPDAGEQRAQPLRGGQSPVPIGTSAEKPALQRRGDYWDVTFDGRGATVRDSKGMHDLAVLLGRPGTEISALDLAASDARRERRVPAEAGDEVLDATARAAYRARITELQGELDEADGNGDPERSARARAELDTIVGELAAATGIGGGPRRTASNVERARKAVSARIADAIARLDHPHPSLARHLRHSVRTGTYCSYDPERPVIWTIEAD